MKKVIVHEPKIVYQSTTDPIMFGGCQDPIIRAKENVLYVKFTGRMDSLETLGKEDKDPVYLSRDGGETWEKSSINEWAMAETTLSNGDTLKMREHEVTRLNGRELPPLPKNRLKTESSVLSSVPLGTTYTVEEIYPILGDEISKTFKADRKKSGEVEAQVEYCNVNWDNMPIQDFGKFVQRTMPRCSYKEDKNGTLWMTVYAGSVAADGTMNSNKLCTHLLRSDDFGHNWDYVSTIIYKDEYNSKESAKWVEGFDEATLEILDNGDIMVIMRSGSLFPHIDGVSDTGYPIPKIYIAKSKDGGKTWNSIKPFYDYGIRPNSVKLGCGTIIMISGRPGVYIRATHDPEAENWEDIIEIIHVPEKDVYSAYQFYSCSNSDICIYNDTTAYIVYSDFTINVPNGEKAKTIVVRKITVEEV